MLEKLRVKNRSNYRSQTCQSDFFSIQPITDSHRYSQYGKHDRPTVKIKDPREKRILPRLGSAWVLRRADVRCVLTRARLVDGILFVRASSRVTSGPARPAFPGGDSTVRVGAVGYRNRIKTASGEPTVTICTEYIQQYAVH